jgi:serine/threonine protein kinase
VAPEILHGAAPSCTSDVYAFGIVLCELATRRDPYEEEEDHLQVIYQPFMLSFYCSLALYIFLL